MRKHLLVAGLAAAACATLATAQPAPAPALPSPPAAVVDPPVITVPPTLTPPCCRLPALTPVKVRFLATLNSQANHAGETFPIKLAMPVRVSDTLTIPEGTPGVGEVIHAAKSRFGGKPGELLLAARYLDFNGVRIPLRSLKLNSGQGDDRLGAAIVVGAFVPLASMLITGGEVTVPQGYEAFAKTSADVVLTEPPAPLPATITTEGAKSQ